jgi:hypothetical protein
MEAAWWLSHASMFQTPHSFGLNLFFDSYSWFAQYVILSWEETIIISRAKCMLAAEEVLEEVCALKLVSWFGSVQVPFPELRTGLLVRFNPEPEPDHILRRKEGNGTHIRACPFTGGTYASSSQARSE